MRCRIWSLVLGISPELGCWSLELFNSRVPKRNSSRTAALPIDAPERRRLPILLRHAWYGLNQAFRRRIAHIGVTPDQFTVMRTLIEHEGDGLIQSELSRLISSDPNTIASLVERMEKAGLVERVTHEKDRRAYRIRLKPGGKRKYQQAREIALSLQGEILSGFSEAEREKFLENLALIADRCRAATEGAAKKT